jgi:DNA-binding transcriptional regulator YdaS (Cro superfamily)
MQPMSITTKQALGQALLRALDRVGGTVRMAETVGVTPQAVSQWAHIPIHHVPRISGVTGLPRHKLRPDLYEAHG